MNVFNQMFQLTSTPSAVREDFDAYVLGKLNIEYCLVISNILLKKNLTFCQFFREGKSTTYFTTDSSITAVSSLFSKI